MNTVKAPRRFHLRSGSVIGVIVTMTALAGCGGGSTDSASGAAAKAGVAAAEPSAAAAAAAAAVAPGRIVFRRYDSADESTGALFTSAADGSDEVQLTHPGANALDDEPAWAPDGTRVVFTRSSDVGSDHEAQRLFAVSFDGSALTSLSPDPPAPGSGVDSFEGTGAFSPDSKQIAFGHGHGKIRQLAGQGEIEFSDIWVMDADGRHRRQVTTYATYSGDVGGVAWSPDGKRLVFARTNAGSTKPLGGRALFTVDLDGSHQRRLAPFSIGAGGTPAWSATGLIVFRAVLDDEAGIGNFFTVRPDGASLTQITHFTGTVISHKVGFSPDGRRIVFAKAGTAGKNDVFTANNDGSDVRPVTRTPLADSSPDWGPDGR